VDSTFFFVVLLFRARDEIIEGWRALHNEGLRYLLAFSSLNIIKIIKSRRIKCAKSAL
jgi:hypothetical protein